MALVRTTSPGGEGVQVFGDSVVWTAGGAVRRARPSPSESTPAFPAPLQTAAVTARVATTPAARIVFVPIVRAPVTGRTPAVEAAPASAGLERAGARSANAQVRVLAPN